ncbi:MAG: zinc finger domain-containing protein [Candidatus Baldrarchaeia archaeon]
MSSEYKPPVCSSCGRPILVDEACVKFPCPNCGQIILWRCEKCKKLTRPYKCPNCDFIGP